MAIFESLANSLKVLAVGDRVKVTLRPEIGRFPNPMEGQITQKDKTTDSEILAPETFEVSEPSLPIPTDRYPVHVAPEFVK